MRSWRETPGPATLGSFGPASASVRGNCTGTVRSERNSTPLRALRHGLGVACGRWHDRLMQDGIDVQAWIAWTRGIYHCGRGPGKGLFHGASRVRLDRYIARSGASHLVSSKIEASENDGTFGNPVRGLLLGASSVLCSAVFFARHSFAGGNQRLAGWVAELEIEIRHR